MKKILLAAAVVLLGSPALASAQDAGGPRIGATIGLADDDFGGTEAFTYGVNVGYDFDLGKAVLGATAEIQDSGEEGFGRDLSLVARAGLKVSGNVMVYGLAGYTNLGIEDLDYAFDGYRVGTGVQVGLTRGVTGQVEYRYSDYGDDVNFHQLALGLGYRF